MLYKESVSLFLSIFFIFFILFLSIDVLSEITELSKKNTITEKFFYLQVNQDLFIKLLLILLNFMFFLASVVSIVFRSTQPFYSGYLMVFVNLYYIFMKKNSNYIFSYLSKSDNFEKDSFWDSACKVSDPKLPNWIFYISWSAFSLIFVGLSFIVSRIIIPLTPGVIIRNIARFVRTEYIPAWIQFLIPGSLIQFLLLGILKIFGIEWHPGLFLSSGLVLFGLRFLESGYFKKLSYNKITKLLSMTKKYQKQAIKDGYKEETKQIMLREMNNLDFDTNQVSLDDVDNGFYVKAIEKFNLEDMMSKVNNKTLNKDQYYLIFSILLKASSEKKIEKIIPNEGIIQIGGKNLVISDLSGTDFSTTDQTASFNDYRLSLKEVETILYENENEKYIEIIAILYNNKFPFPKNIEFEGATIKVLQNVKELSNIKKELSNYLQDQFISRGKILTTERNLRNGFRKDNNFT